MLSKSRILCLALLLLSGPLSATETFPQPPELQPDVDFWVDIFTRYTTQQGVLHDNRHLGVVYERIDFAPGLDRRGRSRVITKQRERLQANLRKLAGGKREGLSAEEARILALWPADVSSAELSAAVGRIRYQQGLKDRFREGLVRAGRWRGHIESEFTDLGVPIELAALPASSGIGDVGVRAIHQSQHHFR